MLREHFYFLLFFLAVAGCNCYDIVAKRATHQKAVAISQPISVGGYGGEYVVKALIAHKVDTIEIHIPPSQLKHMKELGKKLDTFEVCKPYFHHILFSY